MPARGRLTSLPRVGYDIFSEVRSLLSDGQPPENAECPTLEYHIALMRELIVSNGGSLVEIPPVPLGFQFLACLTHDVDHPMVRRHRLDHTMFGFLYRAVIGSVLRLLQGRLSASPPATRSSTSATNVPVLLLV